MKINIAKEFSRLPGPRYRVQGPDSGQKFREEILQPKFKTAQAGGQKLVIELDGVEFGYPTSFLEESFGGLARIEGIDAVLNGLVFSSTEEPLLDEEIRGYIQRAKENSVAS